MKTVKRILYISAFAALGIMPFTSCEDFLTAENKSAGTSADDYFRSEAGLNAFRITAYSYLKNVASPNENGSMNLYNIYEDGTDLYTGCRGRIPSDWHLYTAGANDGDVTDFYAYCKGLINNANAVLYYGGEDSPYAPEMHFLRAYGYYLLTQQFGSVPYLTDYVQDAETNYPRTDLKTIYQAPDEKKALAALDRVTEKWTPKYPNSMKRWKDNWDAISPIFKFSATVRKVIYTTNAIESLNSIYRRLNQQRSVFPSDTALLKALYLSTFEATKRWSTTIRNWAQVYGELSIMYEGRLPE